MLQLISQPSTSRILIAGIFLLMGLLHFIRPEPFMKIMPDYIPWHKAMVYISGIAELLGGAGMLIGETRTAAGYGLIILLFAVFPANIDMAQKAFQQYGLTLRTWILLLRLPLQFVLMYWIYWAAVAS
ncbi:MAG: DoxX family protein [Balneolaceae bacterium]|nr:DoxX family protein [Balneolaceae bacterium]